MSLLVVGSVAFDTVETPCGQAPTTSSAARRPYFSVAASFFAPVRMVAVVGERLPASELDVPARARHRPRRHRGRGRAGRSAGRGATTRT